MSKPDDKSKPVKSICEYADRVRKLTRGGRRRCIFRGLPNAKWKLESAAWRTVKTIAKEDNKKPTRQKFIKHHRDLIDRIRSKGHGYDGARPLHDLELLAKLQHYGAATAFIDFTKNIYVALWFAVDSKQKKNGKVCIVDNTDRDKFSAVSEDEFSSENKNMKIKDLLQPHSYRYWEAQRVGAERIMRQSSIFVFGRHTIAKGDYKEIVIDKKAKRKIWKELNRLHDINAETLFPDFPGLSLANRVGRYPTRLLKSK